LVFKKDTKVKVEYIENNKDLQKDIDLITKSLSWPYFNSALKKLAKENPKNTRLICDYILTE
jgi:hypothetical protein